MVCEQTSLAVQLQNEEKVVKKEKKNNKNHFDEYSVT